MNPIEIEPEIRALEMMTKDFSKPGDSIAPATGYDAAQRERRTWWAVADGYILKAVGYSCPNSPGQWWCPEVGYSLTEGFHLFATKAEALDKGIAETAGEIERLTIRLDGLKELKAKQHNAGDKV